jgi:predicted nucleotidyltransferase
MTLVDDHSQVPALDQAAREQLSRALARDQVLAAFLFGSQARGGPGPLSDIDIAVLHAPDLDRADVLRLTLDLARAAGAALGTGEIDIVPLNHASPLLRHRVARDGVLLVERDPRARVRFQAAALRDYLDTEPLRLVLRRGLRNRLREDRFGRRGEH